HSGSGLRPAYQAANRLAREWGRANLPLARHEPHPSPHPPAPSADRRADAAARLARHARAPQSPPPRLPGLDRRDRSAPVPRRRRGRCRAARLANLVARARRRPNAARRRWDRARVVGTGRAGRRSRRGPRRATMSGRRFRRAAAAAALGLGAVLGALGVLYGEDAPVWRIPLLAAAVLSLCELLSLSRGPAPDAAVERQAVTAVLIARLLVPVLLA